MKCIKENCRMPYMSGNTGFCHELETFIFGENPDCPLPDKILELEKQLREYNCIMDKIIVYHAKNKDKKVVKQ